MTQEEEDLLLKYLCATLPYGVKYCREYLDYERDQEMCAVGTLESIDKDGYINDTKVYTVWDIKPYLRPMSSMTKNEKHELQNILSNNKHGVYLKHDEEWEIIVDSYYPYIPLEGFTNGFNWFNKKMFDYRGLIPMGLAIEAPEGMYNIKTE